MGGAVRGYGLSQSAWDVSSTPTIPTFPTARGWTIVDS